MPASLTCTDSVEQSRAKWPFSLHLNHPQSLPTPVPTASRETRISWRPRCEKVLLFARRQSGLPSQLPCGSGL